MQNKYFFVKILILLNEPRHRYIGKVEDQFRQVWRPDQFTHSRNCVEFVVCHDFRTTNSLLNSNDFICTTEYKFNNKKKFVFICFKTEQRSYTVIY